jgi:large subunit ribosomal protein L33
MRTLIKLWSTAGIGHFYTTTKNQKLKSDRSQLRKYAPRCTEARVVPRDEGLKNMAEK